MRRRATIREPAWRPTGRPVLPKENDDAGPRLQNHRSRRLFREEHRGRDPERRRPCARTLRQVGWFEVVQTRGHIEDGKVAHYQVTLKIGFTLDDGA